MPYTSGGTIDNKKIDILVDSLISEFTDHYTGKIWGDVDGYVCRVIFRLLGKLYGQPDFNILNRGIGVLENTKDQFLERFVRPYEKKKLKENGDAI